MRAAPEMIQTLFRNRKGGPTRRRADGGDSGGILLSFGLSAAAHANR